VLVYIPLVRATRPRPGVLAAWLAFLAGLGPAAVATAQPAGEGIGVYGRFDHDLALSVGLGGGARLGGAEGARGLAQAELRASYLHTAGIALAGSFVPGASRELAGSVAVDLRPLFLISIFENRFTGDSLLDLVRDSFGIEGGLSWDGAHPAFLVGLGTELPIVRDRDRGLFLRLGARLHLTRARWVGGDAAGTAVELGAVLQAHGAVGAGLL